MEIWVLGTLEVSHDGRPVDVRGPLPRRLLALLALTPGRENALGNMAYAAFLLVFISEVMGRFLFYAVHVRIGI